MNKIVVILSWCVVVVVALWAYPELNRCKIYVSPWRDQDKLFSGGLLLLAILFAFFATFYYLKKRKSKTKGEEKE
jgi:hypothetical protein